MPQHDYDIANATGANFRSDINSMAAAIVQTNAGSSAPSTTFPNMGWYDQTTAVLKRRDAGNTAWIQQRTMVVSGTTFYVASAGSDNNSGLTSAAAFRTIQGAVNHVANNIDLGGASVTIQVTDGVFSESLSLPGYVGNAGGALTLQGNTTNPNSCMITSSVANLISMQRHGSLWQISGFRILNPGGTGLLVNAAMAQVGQMDWNSCLNFHMQADRNGSIQISANPTISGSAACHMQAQQGGRVNYLGRTITFSGAPGFSSAFAFAVNAAVIAAVSLVTANSATGKRYDSRANAVIDCGNSGQNILPGTVAGTVQSGGIYV